MKRKKKEKRVYQEKMFDAAKFYCREADKCFRAKAYFPAIVVRVCELEALLRIFDFVENRRPKDRCKKLYWLVNRAFARHWIPHEALRYWKKEQPIPLKVLLHDIVRTRNGVHAHLFDRRLMTRQMAANVNFVVHAMYSYLKIKNARNLMWALYASGEITPTEYWAWKRKKVKP